MGGVVCLDTKIERVGWVGDNKPIGDGRDGARWWAETEKKKKMLLYRDIKSVFMSGPD